MAPNREHERWAWRQGFTRVAGIDEAGRGPLAGPVVAAACIIGPHVSIQGVDDSKKVTRLRRIALLQELTSHAEVVIGIGVVDAPLIDKINILQATIRAMHLAVADLDPQPDYLLVDGRPIPHPALPIKGIVGGDGVSYAIAAASIVAKETRDRLMEEYHEQWPQYGFDRHKGYGTRAHVAALQAHGPCPIHRKTFNWDEGR